MTGIVLAGISGAGKTTVHQAVTAALAAGGCQTLVSIPQALTTTACLHLAGQPALQAVTVLAWLEDLVTFAEQLTARARDGGLTAHREAAHWTPMFVLEGFLYDIPLHEIAISRTRVAPIEQRLAGLGFTLVLLTVPPARIEQQCVIATRANRGPGWSAHLRRLGATDPERAAWFTAAQQRLHGWAATSPLPVTEIDTSAGNWAQITATVLEIMARARRLPATAGPGS